MSFLSLQEGQGCRAVRLSHKEGEGDMRILYVRPEVGLFEATGVPRPRREGGLSAKQQEVLRACRRLEQEFQQEAEALLREYGIRPIVGARSSWRDDGRGDPTELLLGVSPEALVLRAELSVELTRRVTRLARQLKAKWAEEESLKSKLEAALRRLEEEEQE